MSCCVLQGIHGYLLPLGAQNSVLDVLDSIQKGASLGHLYRIGRRARLFPIQLHEIKACPAENGFEFANGQNRGLAPTA
jgi:hypothetical protein